MQARPAMACRLRRKIGARNGRPSANLTRRLKEMVDRSFSGVSTSRASELILRLGFEFIASVLFQSGLRHPTRGGLWFGNTFKDAAILTTAPAWPARDDFMTDVDGLIIDNNQ